MVLVILMLNLLFQNLVCSCFKFFSPFSIIGALKHFENSVDMMRMSMVSPSYCEQVKIFKKYPTTNITTFTTNTITITINTITITTIITTTTIIIIIFLGEHLAGLDSGEDAGFH